MKAVAHSKNRVLAREISAERKRHTKRGYFAVIFVTALGAAFSWYFNGGIFETFAVAAFALGASTVTAAIINTDHHIYYRAVSFSTAAAATAQMVSDGGAPKSNLEGTRQSGMVHRENRIDQMDEDDGSAIRIDEDIFGRQHQKKAPVRFADSGGAVKRTPKSCGSQSRLR
jgi:hypothetical protein